MKNPILRIRLISHFVLLITEFRLFTSLILMVLKRVHQKTIMFLRRSRVSVSPWTVMGCS